MSTTPSAAASGSTYVLGHADAEVQRLLLQGRLYNDYTEHALRLAGLRPGMRVLDIGCGPGDVSFIAAGWSVQREPFSVWTPRPRWSHWPAPAPPNKA